MKMDKNRLLKTAAQLKQVSPKCAEDYHQKSAKLITAMNEAMSQRSGIQNLVGHNNIEMMKDNHANHVRFIGSILKNHNAGVLVDAILWVFRAYRSHGFTTDYWDVQLKVWVGLLKELLTPECFDEVYPYYEWMQINIPSFVKNSDEELVVSNALH